MRGGSAQCCLQGGHCLLRLALLQCQEAQLLLCPGSLRALLCDVLAQLCSCLSGACLPQTPHQPVACSRGPLTPYNPVIQQQQDSVRQALEKREIRGQASPAMARWGLMASALWKHFRAAPKPLGCSW